MRQAILLIFTFFSFFLFAQKTEQTQIQAFLKHQPHLFDESDPNKITGAYVNENNFVVPENIEPNSNWIKHEGVVWENDVIAYRFFANDRFRFDVFGKKTPQLILDTVSTDVSQLTDWGGAILKENVNLGIGTPAFYIDNHIVSFTKQKTKTIKILPSKENQVHIQVFFEEMKVKNDVIDVTLDIVFKVGNPTTYVNLTTSKPMVFATGLAKNPGVTEIKRRLIDKKTAILSTYGIQSFHHHGLGMAIYTNEKIRFISNKQNYLMFSRKPSTTFAYQFMANWSLQPALNANQISTMNEIEQYIFKEISN